MFAVLNKLNFIERNERIKEERKDLDKEFRKYTEEIKYQLEIKDCNICIE